MILKDDEDIAACCRCQYWEAFSERVGECRYDAPSVHMVERADEVVAKGLWPETHATHWCGRYVNEDVGFAMAVTKAGVAR
jgi:hypothetical protein